MSYKYHRHYTRASIPNDACFVKASGEDGAFFDLVLKQDADKHIASLEGDYYAAERVSIDSVPDCLFRDFRGNLRACVDSKLGDGDTFYFPELLNGTI